MIHRPPGSATTEKPGVPALTQSLKDATDLCFNLRGIGWDWSHGLKVPPETRDTSSRSRFILSTIWWTLQSTFLFDISLYAVQWFSPTTFGSPAGGSIFEDTLPPLMRYARAASITTLFGFVAYWMIDCLYHGFTIVGVLIFKQHPSEWPPLFDRPFLSSSLNEFWSTRWHQGFRDCFIHIGGIPFAIVGGKFGGVIGAFVVSGILHDLGCWSMGRGTDPWRVSGFFIMCGVGCCLEVLFKSLTGKRVGGLAGNVWTFGWLIYWGSMIADAWALRGFVGNEFIPTPLRISTYLFGPLQGL